MNTLREASRGNWSYAGTPTFSEIQTGALQRQADAIERIADACEKMTKSYDALLQEKNGLVLEKARLERGLENAKTDRYRLLDEIAALERSNRSLRGHLTRRRKIAKGEESPRPGAVGAQ